MAVVQGLEVVYLYVADVERSLAFYRDVLGLPLERHPRDPGWAEARLEGGVRLALHAAGPHTGAPRQGTVGISLRVADAEEARRRLLAAGVEAGEVERAPWGARVRVTDPDGYEVGLVEPARGA